VDLVAKLECVNFFYNKISKIVIVTSW